VADVTVIVPVFNAYEVLEACLASLERWSPDADVVIVDDASTDPRIAPALERFAAAAPRRRLLTLPENRGFVHAANRGMAAAAGHCVLLNSDTVVTSHWLESLARCLASDPAIATATPWSNNAEIVSVPRFCEANPAPADPEAWARAARASAVGDYPELPTAVGFCMAIRREALQQLGDFDEAAFGRGYGEENDFSCRAASAGWRNVLCEDAYVVHVGGQSFGPLGQKPDETSMARLLERHPSYLDDVMAWIRRDPLAERRAALVQAREALRQNRGAAHHVPDRSGQGASGTLEDGRLETNPTQSRRGDSES
jgi:GT2 family glycosyltransferase